jgi:2-isopropylmalate synthase
MSSIIIFDTTLRDGEQSPGVSLNIDEKIQIARQLVLLNVDVIEAGFPVTSSGDFEAVQAIANEVKGIKVAALARAVEKDIDRAAQALKKAESPRIHVFLATSEIHRKYKLRKAKDEIVRMAVEGVKYARSYVEDVEFSPEDASRTEPAFLAEVVEAVIDAGATTVNIPDTVGYALPDQYAALISGLKKDVQNIDKAVISVHCHNDLGLAVANSLAAIMAGAGQVECTINGIGERAGNASLEEIVMVLKTRSDCFNYTTNIVTKELISTSRLVGSLTGMHPQKNKAIVGENAFAHGSGVHQDGVLKEKMTYEIMKPEEIGLSKTRIVLGKLSGRHALLARAKDLGYTLSDEELDRVFKQFKILADKKKEVYDEDVEALVLDEKSEVSHIFDLEAYSITSGTDTTPTAKVRLKVGNDRVDEEAATGDGPVDAICKAIDRITGMSGTLMDYNIRAVTSGKDAVGEVSLDVKVEGETARGRAACCDIIEASAKAYLSAINKIAHKLDLPFSEKVGKGRKGAGVPEQ